MTGKESLQIVYNTILENLTEDNFNFENYVTTADEKHTCGTVCCILGWFPKYFPNAGFTWKADNEAVGGLALMLNNQWLDSYNYITHLYKLLKVDKVIIDYLFFGNSAAYTREGRPELGSISSLADVKTAWLWVLENDSTLSKDYTFPYSLETTPQA